MKTRIFFLDNLRTFLILLVVVLHAGMTYVEGFDSFWIVSDQDKINSLGLVNMYLDLFVMFSIFFISGYFMPNSLQSKSNATFIWSKFKRILLPWLVAVFTLIPAYKVIFLYARGLPQQEWYSYFHIFIRAGDGMSFFANNPTQSWLWFLPVLFVFQMVYLVMAKLRLLSLKVSLRTGVLLTFAVGLIYSLVISYSGLRGWYHSAILDFQRERLLVYFSVFMLGSLCQKHSVFATQPKSKKYYVMANVVLSISLAIFTVVALNFFFNMVEPQRNHYYVSRTFDVAIYYSTSLLSALGFLYILIHTFRKNFNRTNPVMKHLNKQSYQVYIIHMIVLGSIALLLSNSGLPVMVKYPVLILFTFITSNLLIFGYRRISQVNSLRKPAIAALFPMVILVLILWGYSHQSGKEPEYRVAIQQAIDPPETSLHNAVINGDSEAVKQHVKSGSDLDIAEPSGGSSPLITAAVFGQAEIAGILIDAGANVNFMNREGSTPLHTASFFCRTEIVKRLLAEGADKSLKNSNGHTAIESVSGSFETVRPVYEYFQNTLGPLGLELDLVSLEKTRPVVASILSEN